MSLGHKEAGEAAAAFLTTSSKSLQFLCTDVLCKRESG